MIREEYKKPEMEIIGIEEQDIVRTSGEPETDNDGKFGELFGNDNTAPANEEWNP